MMQYFPKVIATYRRPTGSYVDSRWVADAVDGIPVQIIAPQPASGRDLQMLPEGDRTFRHLKTWSPVELLADDVLKVSGFVYRVVKSKDYQTDGGYYKILMREVQHER